MKTRLAHYGNYIELIIDNGKASKDDKQVLASMTLFEGTGCWMMTDIRLTKYAKPHAYSGSLNSNVINAFVQPHSEAEREHVRSVLREFKEHEDGSITWCSYDGMVKGSPTINGYAPTFNNDCSIGYFNRADGLAKLKEIQAFWDGIPNLEANWRIENPNHQKLESELSFEIVEIRLSELKVINENNPVKTLKP